MKILQDYSLTELKRELEVLTPKMPRYRAQQIFEWANNYTPFDEMSNLPQDLRDTLKKDFIDIPLKIEKELVSKDGTKKYLYQYGEFDFVEAVLIPDKERATLCISTQVGCKMNCQFCATARQGFKRNLDCNEILNIIRSLPEYSQLTNLVYMGMGEPFDNLDEVLKVLEILTSDYGYKWSPKRITVSSVGLKKGLERFLNESDCHLAISLHNPFAVERQEIMPIEKANHLSDVITLLKQYDWSHQRRVSFEYICWGGVNDTPKHANELVRLLRGLDCRINLIRFHSDPTPTHDSSEDVRAHLNASNEQNMLWMRDYLSEHGITTTIRRSRGEDILAACGMLVNALNK